MIHDKDKIIADNRSKCICDPCPTYNECMRAETSLLFCVLGKSQNCTFDKKGCLCPGCPIKPALELTRAYYCIRGSEQEQKNSS